MKVWVVIAECGLSVFATEDSALKVARMERSASTTGYSGTFIEECEVES